jgi:hypothetical protein
MRVLPVIFLFFCFVSASRSFRDLSVHLPGYWPQIFQVCSLFCCVCWWNVAEALPPSSHVSESTHLGADSIYLIFARFCGSSCNAGFENLFQLATGMTKCTRIGSPNVTVGCFPDEKLLEALSRLLKDDDGVPTDFRVRRPHSASL